MFDESEIEDFDRVLRESGFVPRDFEVTHVGEPVPAPRDGLVMEMGEVTVTRKKNGISRAYPAGDDGSAWVVEFQADLRSGVFR